MKRILISFLIAILSITCLSYATFQDKDHEHEHLIHVHIIHAVSLGDSYGSCPNCGQSMRVEQIFSQPTCTADGSGTLYCPNCGAVENYPVTFPKLNHSYESKVTKNATCTESGTMYYTCTRCSNSYTESIPALGHSYVVTASKDPTCTATGQVTYTCTRCSNTYNETIAALGHNYVSQITKEATCKEDGIQTFRCSRCSDSYTKPIPALGHDMTYEETKPTCTESGHKHGVCSRCEEEYLEIYPALGHDLKEFTFIKEPTCTENGLREAECARCGEHIGETVALLGHQFPEEWTIVKEASYTEEGMEQKICERCGEVMQRTIPRVSSAPLVIGGGGIVAAAGAAFFLLKKRGTRVVKETAERGLPSFEDKTVVACTSDEKLIEALKDRHYLSVTTCEYEEIDDNVEDADLLLIDVEDEEKLDSILSKKEDVLKEISLGLIVDQEKEKELSERLKQLKKDNEIIGHVSSGTSPYVTLTKLVLPVLKPDLKSDESLGNIGMIADALGIPGISSVIDVFVAGRDIKSTLEAGELGVSEKATIIGDIASILGLDTIASVAGLVDDVNSIKAAFDEEAGANEVKGGVGGAKDIVDVISDMISKD